MKTTIEQRQAFYNDAYLHGGYAKYNSPTAHFAFAEITNFTERHCLGGARGLEVGCGRGLFQDLVEDYVGCDISEAAGTHLRKPFVPADSECLPFADHSFDAAWSIAVLEHVPEPERALAEMRRVLRPGGLLFLKVAWHCRWWRCEGIPIRPYADLSWRQRWAKLTLPLRAVLIVRAACGLPRRGWRIGLSVLHRDPQRLPFGRLQPDRSHYWMVDSDAACCLDPLDVILWFRSRGDECLSHPTRWLAFKSRSELLVFRVRHERGGC